MQNRNVLFNKDSVQDEKYRRREYICKLVAFSCGILLSMLICLLILKYVHVNYYSKKESDFVTDLIIPLIGGGAICTAYARIIKHGCVFIRGEEPLITSPSIRIKSSDDSYDGTKLVLICSERENITEYNTSKKPIEHIPILNATFLYELVLHTKSNCSGYIYEFDNLVLSYQNNSKIRLVYSEAKYEDIIGKTGYKEHVYSKVSERKHKRLYEIFDNGGKGAYIPIFLVIDEKEKQEYSLFELETEGIRLELQITVYNRNGRKKVCTTSYELERSGDERGECILTTRQNN